MWPLIELLILSLRFPGPFFFFFFLSKVFFFFFFKLGFPGENIRTCTKIQTFLIPQSRLLGNRSVKQPLDFQTFCVQAFTSSMVKAEFISNCPMTTRTTKSASKLLQQAILYKMLCNPDDPRIKLGSLIEWLRWHSTF